MCRDEIMWLDRERYGFLLSVIILLILCVDLFQSSRIFGWFFIILLVNSEGFKTKVFLSLHDHVKMVVMMLIVEVFASLFRSCSW